MARWRTSAEGQWDPRRRMLDGWSHTQWFGQAGEFLGEEWRRFSNVRGAGPEPEQGRSAADRLADHLILGGCAILLVTVALFLAVVR